MGELRLLTGRDSSAVEAVLASRPVFNVFVAARFFESGVDGFGNPLYGWFESGRLVSMLSDGYTLFPVCATEAALDGFAARGVARRATSITGVRDEVIGLYNRLCHDCYRQWASPRDVRDNQVVMVEAADPSVMADPRVVPVGTRLLNAYMPAAMAMYTEEVGVAPYDQISYRNHVTDLMMRGRAYALVDNGRVWFKADVVAATREIAQIGGVWMDPALRGRGMAAPCMAAVVSHVRQTWPTVTLYVNAHNAPALACYRRVGFADVGRCATVLY